jgi:hypothetical protein
MTPTYLPSFYGIDFSKVFSSILSVASQPSQQWQNQQQGRKKQSG